MGILRKRTPALRIAAVTTAVAAVLLAAQNIRNAHSSTVVDRSVPLLRAQLGHHFEIREGEEIKRLDLNRKSGTHIIINIGSNDDPIVPRPTDDPCTLSIAFEPIVGHTIPAHPALHVVPAAVTAESGLASMFVYNKHGVSSSLSRPAKEGGWNRDGGALRVVPAIGLRTVLESLRKYSIDFLMTDMQGHDFSAVSSVGSLLKDLGVKRIMTEVYLDNVNTYQDVNNDFCLDWLPHMTRVGYIFEGLGVGTPTETILPGYRNAIEAEASCQEAVMAHGGKKSAGLKEYNAFWRLEEEEPSKGFDKYMYEQHSPREGEGYKFAEEEYQKCEAAK